MEMNPVPSPRKASAVVVTVLLAFMTAALGYMVHVVAAQAGQADPKTHSALARLAWLTLLLLGVSAVLLVWSAARTLRLFVARRERHPPTPYVDAWAEAGRRMKVDDEEDNEDEPPGPD